MCGRVILLGQERIEEVAAALNGRGGMLSAGQGGVGSDDTGPGAVDAGDSGLNAYPGSQVNALHEDSHGCFSLQRLVWGIRMPWSSKPVHNTRIESIVEDKAAWRRAAREGRCILPVAAFFEPHATETAPSVSTGRPVKRPYVFTGPRGAPLLLACVSVDGQLSIVTTGPNEDVAPVHHRMPLVLRPDEVSAWTRGEAAALADRSGVTLLAAPEHQDLPAAEQLKLC